MKRSVQITADGSATMYSPLYDATYHSKHGAVQESMHVFIKHGLEYMVQQKMDTSIAVFEMGFGTGLNALLTANYAIANNVVIDYETLELHPLSVEEVEGVNYEDEYGVLKPMHQSAWGETEHIHDVFSFTKQEQSLLDYEPSKLFDVIYYDAFAPSAQPELWTIDIFKKLYAMLNDGGILVTYCSKSDVRRAMLAAGFNVEKLQGPPGKREMLRAHK